MHTEQNSDDCVEVRGLRIPVRVGVFPHERVEPRVLLADLTLWSPAIRRAGSSDRLEDTVDYASLCAAILKTCADKHVNLIESVAEQVARVCLAEPNVARVRVRIAKPGAVPVAEEAAVLITRVGGAP